MKIKSLTIYCSSSQKIDKKFYKMAKEIAEIISKYKIKVIYGGGNLGLMGEISRNLIRLKTEVIGIIPKFLIKNEEANIITLSYISVDENFAKQFTEALINEMSKMYISHQTKQARNKSKNEI